MINRTLSFRKNKIVGGKKMEKLRLVRPEKKHEKQAKAYIEEFRTYGSNIHGVGGLTRYFNDYDGWLKHLEEMRNLEPNDKLVPGETFFLVKRNSDGTEYLVGMIDVRFVLNESLWAYGGNIGYSIRPSERRKGYNKVNLYLALKVCQNHGIEVALLDCDKNNVGSAKTMRALGGRLLRECSHRNDDGEDIMMQWYVIDVDAALEKYASQYDQFVSEYPN